MFAVPSLLTKGKSKAREFVTDLTQRFKKGEELIVVLRKFLFVKFYPNLNSDISRIEYGAHCPFTMRRADDQ